MSSLHVDKEAFFRRIKRLYQAWNVSLCTINHTRVFNSMYLRLYNNVTAGDLEAIMYQIVSTS